MTQQLGDVTEDPICVILRLASLGVTLELPAASRPRAPPSHPPQGEPLQVPSTQEPPTNLSLISLSKLGL